MIWSWNTFRLDKIIQDKGKRVLYYVRDGPKRSFVREELMLIPEETQLPPDYVQGKDGHKKFLFFLICFKKLSSAEEPNYHEGKAVYISYKRYIN